MQNKKAILVISFGTTFKETRKITIDAIAESIAEKYSQYTVLQAFTSKMVIDAIRKRDGEHVYTVYEALQKLVDDEYQEIMIQPTHLMNGLEYEKMRVDIQPFIEKFKKLQIGSPLLTSNDDYLFFMNAVLSEIPEVAESDTAVVFMGHGTTHFANAAYAALEYRIRHEGYQNVFIGTVEGYPDIMTVKKDLIDQKFRKAVLYPLMIVAGDHATHDMAGEQVDSWKNILCKEMEVEIVLKGLGEYKGIHKMFLQHLADAPIISA